MHQVLLTIKTSAEIKGFLQEIAWKELRTLSGQVEMILLQWLEAKGHIEKEDKNSSSPIELNGR